ncbi:MAG: ATP-binding protein, partial [Campylobacterota bacterium]|nr:ATP-binding protein [Campylobacterota bacterium]
ANMSHEIRTPLNAILGFVTILKKRTTEEKSLNYLNIIDTSGQSLLTIINDILDFSKIQSGKFSIVKHPVDPVSEFSAAVMLFASKAYEKHIVYSIYIDPKMPSSINIDSTRIKQVLSNLLSNAIKFTPEDGEIKVKIIVQKSELVIHIQDNGIGISKENQSKIFSAFEQADGSTTRKYGGTGLGLSISSKLALLMGGKLSLVSEENRGSTFTLKVPIEVLNPTPIELIDPNKFSEYKFALLHSCKSCEVQTKLMKRYLQDFGAQDIVEINEYSDSGEYDILIFVPDDTYNEEIVLSDRPSIALLRTDSIKLSNFAHIKPLYAPFVPKAIVETINNLSIETLKKRVEKPQDTIDADDKDEKLYKGNILVAEDNKTNQLLIGLLLDDYGINFTIANNGLQAVEMFKSAKYDLVLMDENMPELNGISAMQQIKAYEKENSLLLTPIVALTASVLTSDKERFLNAGMDGFVGKPIDAKELEAIFDFYLAKNSPL